MVHAAYFVPAAFSTSATFLVSFDSGFHASEVLLSTTITSSTSFLDKA
jgi:hypothetical protein